MTRACSGPVSSVHSAGTPFASTRSIRTSAGSAECSASEFEALATLTQLRRARVRGQLRADAVDLGIGHFISPATSGDSATS